MAYFNVHVEECIRKLEQYRTHNFPGLVNKLNEPLGKIRASTETIKKCSQFLSIDIDLLSLGHVAREQTIQEQAAAVNVIEQSKIFTVSFFHQIYGPFQENSLDHTSAPCSFSLPAGEPTFAKWLNEIASLQMFFYKQNLIRVTTERPVTLGDYQGAVESALDHLEQLYQILWHIRLALQTAQTEANSALHQLGLVGSTSLSAIQNLDLTWFTWSEKSIRTLCHNIYQRFSLIITRQPDPDLMKSPGKVQVDYQRLRKEVEVVTRTSISVKLINFKGLMQLYTLPEIRVGLISESRAEDLSNLMKFSSAFIEYDANTFQCSPDNAQTEHCIPFEHFISTEMKSQQGAIDTNKQVYKHWETYVELTNISVTNVDRKSYDKKRFLTSQQKFYFLVTVSHPFWEEGVFAKAWTVSTPVIVRTNISQVEKSLAVTSWWTYFSENNSIPCVMKEKAALSEIKVLLRDCFWKWTCTAKSPQGILLRASHLNNLARMVVDLERNNVPDFQPEGTGDNSTMITLEHLYYANLPNCDFTFWLWFFKAAILLKTQPYLREMWDKCSFFGFFGKEAALKKLHRPDMQAGDYILRFSESERSVISCTFVSISAEQPQTFSILNHAFKLDRTSVETFKSSFLKTIYMNVGMGREVRKAFSRLYPNKSTLTAFPLNPESHFETERNEAPIDGYMSGDDEELNNFGYYVRTDFPYVSETVVLIV